ncbi:peptidoglycan D,D-transpeptidase FtsI family protein [Metabacillus arenae]|uniref:Penicillin-binding protein 2 n=1 Tax=Metabacillus arenae TaxID=2771434 RepID=A0A926RYR8_9BACI|nr:penicillin-binding protein 2 [Metabacillus arenae]MBD1382055.1 penicillin-binding protein 2 [Metabacillus arenae]
MISSKRLKWMGFVILAVFFILIGRLAEIQLFTSESFSENHVNLVEESVNQRTQEVLIDDGRGRFVDRNLKPLSDKREPTLVLFPFVLETSWPMEQLSSMINVPVTKINDWLEEAKEPLILGEKQGVKLSEQDIKKINDMKVPGVFGIYKQIPLKDSIADHTIGLTSENEEYFRKKYPDKDLIPGKTKVGVTGLEEAYDEFLLPDTETKLLYHVDGNGHPLFGVNVKYLADSNPFYPVSIKTTIDADIQKTAESLLNSHSIESGGLVLLDAKTSELLALVSKPDLDLKNKNSQLNHMIQPSFPGSVFKTVIAAAAIENNLDHPSRTFNCDLNLYGEADDEKEAGALTFQESFAESCNYTFTTLANELLEKDKNAIEVYADKLGLIEPVGWQGEIYHYENFRQIPKERKGIIWLDEKEKRVPKAVAQTAIGQKDVRVSPLAIANMMATISRGGQKMQVKLVDSILYKNETTMHSFSSNQLDGEKIDKYTAEQLQKLLRHVVTDGKGTGRRFQTSLYSVAGKSGTAETGKKNQQGEKLYHKWFAGYFPVENPKYALAVVHMDTKSEEAATNGLYEDMVKELHAFDKKRPR